LALGAAAFFGAALAAGALAAATGFAAAFGAALAAVALAEVAVFFGAVAMSVFLAFLMS
jgi:hypothetical protein